MPEPNPTPLSLERDGAGQSQRRLPNLAPKTAGIDERTLTDWLAFAQAYSRELKYYNLGNKPDGDWRKFLNPGNLDEQELPAHWQEIESFLANPDSFDDTCVHRRPHLVLFLAFLHLLRLSQQRLNLLTRQHLDFYYQKFLALEKQAAQPDSVIILAKPSADVPMALLPAGTWLEAGKDSQGDELFYRTGENLEVNQAQVKHLYSVFVDKKVTGIRQAREACLATGGDPLLAMFGIVYGDPLPLWSGKELDGVLLAYLGEMVDFVDVRLHLDFQAFRNLMRIKNSRNESASADWGLINGKLEIIGQAVRKSQDFKIDPPYSPDFNTNLETALKGKPDYSVLPNDITSMEDVYAQSDRPLVEKEFIIKQLHLTKDQFKTMMDRKMEVDNDWRIVNGLLEGAGQRQRGDPDYRLVMENSTQFDANLKSAVGELDFSAFKAIFEVNGTPGDLDRFNTSLQQIEAYFSCTLEDFTQLMDAEKRENQTDAKNRPKPTSADWARVYATLAAIFARKKLNELKTGNKSQKEVLEAMLRLALGEPTLAIDKLLSHLAAYRPEDDAFVAIRTALLDEKSTPDLNEQDWKAVIDTLGQAWRKRVGDDLIANQEEWLNLYATEDATNMKVDNSGGTPRWRTFGQRRQASAKDQAQIPLLGWSIASPVFCLSQGQRDVTLTLVFQGDNYDNNKINDLLDDSTNYPFQIEAGSEKGWVTPATVSIVSGDFSIENGWATPVKKTDSFSSLPQKNSLKALRLTLGFDVTVPPLAALPGTESRWPLIRILLRPASKENASAPYPLFQRLVLERVLIHAAVDGLQDLRMENDEGSLAAGKPFEPFGVSPSAGSRFEFVHPELVIKRLDKLEATLQWMKVPDDNLVTYYKNYPDITDDKKFSAKISLVDHRLEIPLEDTAALFKAVASNEHTICISGIPAIIETERPGYAYVPELAPFNLAEPATWQRYWRFELNGPDFQHGNYARVSAQKSIEFAAAVAAKAIEQAAASKTPAVPAVTGTGTGTDTKAIEQAAASQTPANPSILADTKANQTLPLPVAADYQVNPPYTPKLKSFSVGYECSVEIIMNPAQDAPPEILAQRYGSGEERIFYQQAFGVAEIQPEPDPKLYKPCSFLPSYGYEGELYIGLEGVVIPRDGTQDLAMLFQMAEGSANPDLEPQLVEWHYLSGNRWVSLSDGGILADSTHGLIEAGIIKFRLPEARPNTLLPENLYWLRAAVAQYCDSVCDTVAIHTQAVSATWVDRGNAPDHLNQPLPAGTITKTADAFPGILAISQPYTSFGGKPGEQDVLFNTRVSERLRHKQRALTLWDYEHLILEQFPGIYKAKCIPASSMEPGELGKVDIIVIPDIRNRLPFNPFEPKATAGQLNDISRFLEGYVSPLAEVKVKNAYYVPVRVRFAVRFKPGYDPGFYKTSLNEELNRFLSPWAYKDSNDVVIGGKIYANSIVDFLEKRTYVDYVAELKLFINEDGLGFKLVADTGDHAGYRVRSERPDGVLVADRQHVIDLITDTRFEDAKFNGIGYMKIELDFIVA